MEVWCDNRQASTAVIDHPVFDRVLTDNSNDDFFLAKNMLTQNEAVIGEFFPIHDAESYNHVRSKIGILNWIVLDFSGWKMIPIENIISECEGTPTRIAVFVYQEQDINGIAFALELGVDAIIIANNSELIAASEIAKSMRLENASTITTVEKKYDDTLELRENKIIKIESGGFGERYCIDLTCLISSGEGMLIGSSAASLALVHGEVIESEFVPSRPFRVNAGPPHSYVLMASGATKYLSELSSGDEVMLVNEQGIPRSATIGRLKIEKRPFLTIYWENNYDIPCSIFLQQAETVRVLVRVGEVKSVTNLTVGGSILCYDSAHARHIGNQISTSSREV